MTVRMVGEKLAREAGRRSASVEVDDRKVAGAGAAAAIQAIREQAASMSDVLQELSAVVAALSSDVEEVIQNGVTTELLAQAEAAFNTDLQERMQEAVLPLFADGEDGSTAQSWAEKVTQAAVPAITFEAVEALRELAGKAIQDGLQPKSDSEEEGEKVPEPKKELELHVAAGVSATDMMSEWLGEMKAAREREKRLMELLERQQQQMEKQGSSSSGDEIAYEAGRKATLLELSEKLAVKAGPTFTFAKPMKDRDD